MNCWVKAITNHLWWCSSNCNGDKDWLEESWISIVHHSVNEHSFEGEVVKECHHAPIDQETSLKKKWLKKGSRAHNALREVVLDKRLRKDIGQLSELLPFNQKYVCIFTYFVDYLLLCLKVLRIYLCFHH